MLCLHGLQSLSPFMDVYQPLPTFHRHHLLQRNLEELSSSLTQMDRLQQAIMDQTEPFQTSLALNPVSYQLDKEGEHPVLTLDTRGFSPEELCVKQVGRKLKVSGKTEKKQEDESGCYSYRRQEFRQEFDLPEGLNPEEVTCYLRPDGKLQIQEARTPGEEKAETELTIRRSSEEEETQQSVCPQTEDSSRQDTPEHMDSSTCSDNTE